MANTLPKRYRQPIVGRLDPLLRRCVIGSSVAGLAVLIVVLVTPLRSDRITDVDEIPEQFARLILDPPRAKAPAPTRTATPDEEVVEETTEPEPEPEPIAPPPERRRRPPDTAPTMQPEEGKAGRERAKKEVTETLARTTAALDGALKDLSAALDTSTETETTPKKARRRRSVRSGRSSSDVAAVNAGDVRTGGAGDVDGSAIAGAAIELGSVSLREGEISFGEGKGGDATGGAEGSVASPYRTNASLMTVVRRYAAGIRYCYENELKRDPTLEGKISVTITIAPSGEVTEVVMGKDTVGSDSMRECALAQIREWRFPEIEEGVTTFRVPFVFTPPGTDD